MGQPPDDAFLSAILRDFPDVEACDAPIAVAAGSDRTSLRHRIGLHLEIAGPPQPIVGDKP